MSRHQPNPNWITTDERQHQEQGLLDQAIEMRREPSPLSTRSTDRVSSVDERRDTTNLSLLGQEDRTSGPELSTGSTVAGNTAQHPSYNDAPAASPLHEEKSSGMITGWPSSPKPIKTPIYVKVLNGLFDVLLLAGSAAFLAFAIIVDVHDQVPTADHPGLTTTLIRVTKYVLSLQTSIQD